MRGRCLHAAPRPSHRPECCPEIVSGRCASAAGRRHLRLGPALNYLHEASARSDHRNLWCFGQKWAGVVESVAPDVTIVGAGSGVAVIQPAIRTSTRGEGGREG